MPFMRTEGKHVLSNEDYHSDKHYFSSSQLKEALVSPAHFKHYVIDKKGEKKSTSSLELGTLTHTILLEPHKFDDEYVVYGGELNKDGSIPKGIKDKFRKENPNREVITQADYEFACRARANVETYPKARELFYDKGCEYEMSYFHHCKDTGLRLRVRPDILNLEKGYIVDLKTARDIDPYQFKRAVSYTWDYDLSCYMYCYVMYCLYGVQLDYYWGVVGKEDMAPVAIYKCSQSTMDEGKKKFWKACDNIKNALTVNDDYRYQMEPQEL